MTLRFRVHVIRANGHQGMEERLVVNAPNFGSDDESAIGFVRKLWARERPTEQYPDDGIEVIGEGESTTPHPGQFPPGFVVPA